MTQTIHSQAIKANSRERTEVYIGCKTLPFLGQAIRNNNFAFLEDSFHFPQKKYRFPFQEEEDKENKASHIDHSSSRVMPCFVDIEGAEKQGHDAAGFAQKCDRGLRRLFCQCTDQSEG